MEWPELTWTFSWLQNILPDMSIVQLQLLPCHGAPAGLGLFLELDCSSFGLPAHTADKAAIHSLMLEGLRMLGGSLRIGLEVGRDRSFPGKRCDFKFRIKLAAEEASTERLH